MLKKHDTVKMFASVLFCALFAACDLSIDPGTLRGEKNITINNSGYQKIDFEKYSTVNVTIKDIYNKDIYLVKTNKAKTPLSAEKTGSVVFSKVNAMTIPARDASRKAGSVSVDFSGLADGGGFHRGYKPAEEWNSNPPLMPSDEKNTIDRSAGGGRRTSATAASLKDSSLNDTWDFWVEDNLENWQQIEARLTAVGAKSKIWVYDNKITGAEAEELRDKFDALYGYVTRIFGYEYGGEGGGGVDGDPKIQILVYEIPEDGVIGYFWSKDYYSQATLEAHGQAVKTNNAEIFYLDAGRGMDQLASTLVHEFQHMINFNQKTVKNNRVSSSWYNEMLSMLAEDMISPKVGVPQTNDDHPVNVRIPLFLDAYFYTGVTEWYTDTNTLTLVSYANVYAFGAYLARNYGGADLVRAMAANSKVDEDSVTEALSGQGCAGGFDQAFGNYGEALVYNDFSHCSFNKTVTRTIAGEDYEFKQFNIFDITAANQEIPHKGLNYQAVNSGRELRSRGIVVETTDDWQGVSGDLTITLSAPRLDGDIKNKNVDVYILIK
jgi:hypothetical protein